LSTWLGKILRLNVDEAADEYTVPPDNPFVGVEGALPEIWAYGLRNPWRFSFDRLTGDMFIADVGQNQWEEVNYQPANSSGGENYGWRIMEGTHCFQQATCDQTGLVLPFYEYDHSNGCSVTGGYIYRGQLYPELTGNYFFSDYCSGNIWRSFQEGDRWQTDKIKEQTGILASSLGEDVNGEIYVLNYFVGSVYRIAPGE
jgi:glucose/arabinose dehydrogenase